VRDDGRVITLIKPHYEADAALLRGGVLPEDAVDAVVQAALSDLPKFGFEVVGATQSPIRGAKGNIEMLALLRPFSASLMNPESDH
jgi:predicted rRNA methylase YqxC with S4 and FtsJ domains